jgi:hypothetical protein
VEKVIVALEAARPDGIRYASLLQPDGETFVALLQIDDSVENPLVGLPEYRELLEIVEACVLSRPSLNAGRSAGRTGCSESYS